MCVKGSVLSWAILSCRNDLSVGLIAACLQSVPPLFLHTHNRLYTETYLCGYGKIGPLIVACDPFNILFFICSLNKWKSPLFHSFYPVKWDHGQNLSCDFTCRLSMITLVSLAWLNSSLVDILLYIWTVPLRQSNEEWLKIRNYLPRGKVSQVYHSHDPYVLARRTREVMEWSCIHTLSAMVAMYLSSTYIFQHLEPRAPFPPTII